MSPQRVRSASRALAAILAALACCAGCVTESVDDPRGVKVQPGATTRGQPAKPATIPAGPVATPAVGGTVSSAAVVAVQPLGTVFYDGQQLPLFSPDGRSMVAQSGEAPTWPSLLAEPAAEPANRTSLTLFDVSGRQVEPMATTEPIPGGLMLGRSADNAGFLVEAPQRDGSRWIGKVNWRSGVVEWLAKDHRVNAHAVLTAGGGLCWVRREIGASVFDLVLREPGMEESARPCDEGTYAFPMTTDDPDLIYALRIGKAGTELDVIRVLRAPGVAGLGPSVTRRTLSTSTDALLAHQVAMTASGPLFDAAPRQTPALVALSPRHGRVGVFDTTTGLFQPLIPKCIAAVPSPDPARPGWYCTTPDGLTFVAAGRESGPGAKVLLEPYIAHPVAGAVPALLLVGPVKNQPDRLQIVRLVLRTDSATGG